MIVAALIHDIGGTLAPYNHANWAAAILQTYVSEKVCWIVKHHDIFMKYYWGHFRGLNRDERKQYRNHPYYQATVYFCHNYDQNSFDPDHNNLPLFNTFFYYLKKETYSYQFSLQKSNCIIFQDFRVLHGRTAFEPLSGKRILNSGYVDWNFFVGKRNFKCQ